MCEAISWGQTRAHLVTIFGSSIWVICKREEGGGRREEGGGRREKGGGRREGGGGRGEEGGGRREEYRE